MKWTVLVAALGLAFSAAGPTYADDCFSFHGRLQMGNGTPSARIWRIGTTRILGVPDGPPGREDANLPENIRLLLPPDPFVTVIYGDFHVCPLTPERPGSMQMVRVESARVTAVRRN